MDGLTTINEGKIATGDLSTGTYAQNFQTVIFFFKHFASNLILRFLAMYTCWMFGLDKEIWSQY